MAGELLWVSNIPVLQTVPGMLESDAAKPGQAPRVQSAHEVTNFVSPTYRPPLPPRKYSWYSCILGTAVAQWLRCCATNRKVAGSIQAGVIGIFH